MSGISSSMRGAVVTLAVVVGLALAYVVGTSSAQADEPDAAGPAISETITIRGSGSTSVVPDEVHFDLSVTTRAEGLDDALSRSSAELSTAVDALVDQGVAREDVRTTGAQMRPTYRRVKGQAPEPTGYSVTQSVRVEVALEDAGDAITAATKDAGRALRVGGIRLAVSDETQATKEARDEAMADSRATAEQYAKASGRRLGRATKIDEPRDDRGVFEAQSLSSADASTGRAFALYAGEQDLTVQVEVVWELL